MQLNWNSPVRVITASSHRHDTLRQSTPFSRDHVAILRCMVSRGYRLQGLSQTPEPSFQPVCMIHSLLVAQGGVTERQAATQAEGKAARHQVQRQLAGAEQEVARLQEGLEHLRSSSTSAPLVQMSASSTSKALRAMTSVRPRTLV